MEDERMASKSVFSVRCGQLSRLTTLILLSATLYGCLASDMVVKLAEGENPNEAVDFVLTASVDTYEITRWWGSNQETISLSRRDLPTGCDSARFFLNDATHELKMVEPARATWITGLRPPLPDDNYPPCALLVLYGSFSELPAQDGVVITSSTGIVAKGERQQPCPSAWALAPGALVADIYIFLGALVTMPAWAPVGIMLENNEAKQALEAKEKEKGLLPLAVATCWTTIDSEMKNGGFSNPDHKFTQFEWAPGAENAYAIKTADEACGDDLSVPIDTRVILRQGRVAFRSLWTAADFECGLLSGDVVATRLTLLK